MKHNTKYNESHYILWEKQFVALYQKLRKSIVTKVRRRRQDEARWKAIINKAKNNQLAKKISLVRSLDVTDVKFFLRHWKCLENESWLDKSIHCV